MRSGAKQRQRRNPTFQNADIFCVDTKHDNWRDVTRRTGIQVKCVVVLLSFGGQPGHVKLWVVATFVLRHKEPQMTLQAEKVLGVFYPKEGN